MNILDSKSSDKVLKKEVDSTLNITPIKESNDK